MAIRTTETVTTAGLNAAYVAVAASDRFTPGSILHVKNNNASACAVSLITKQLFDGLDLPDKTISVPAGQERFIDISTDSIYRDTADGRVEVTFSVTTSVTAAVIARG